MNYHNITKCDQNNGDGLRVVLWVSGCSHHCEKCQNHQTWNPNSGILFDENARQEIFAELSNEYISGITLSGGDPLNENNIDEILKLVSDIRTLFPNKTIWIYSGYYWEEIFEPSFTEQSDKWIKKYLKQCEVRKKIISMCDVFIDGRYNDSQRDVTLKWKGSRNQSVIDVKKTLENREMILYAN